MRSDEETRQKDGEVMRRERTVLEAEGVKDHVKDADDKGED